MADITTWADGLGVWHVRVPSDAHLSVRRSWARKALRLELELRVKGLDPRVWQEPVRVPALDDAETVVYRERDLDA